VDTDKKLLFCNVDFDTDLASVRSSRQQQSCLEARFYYSVCGSGDDRIILDAAPHGAYASYLADHGIALPRQHSDEETLPDYDAFPWGWSAAAVDRFVNCGARLSHPPLESVRAVNSRLFCSRITERHGLGIAGSRVCASAEEVRSRIQECRTFPLVIKPEHGNAGIGFIHVASTDQAEDARIGRLFAGPGSAAVVEPWVSRLGDLSSRFRVDRAGRVHSMTHHRTLNNRAGTYFGNLLEPEDSLVAGWKNHLDAGVQTVSRELHASGYFGPAGLDWVLYEDAVTGKKNCALVDINARQPMSFVADCLRRRLAPGRNCLFLFAPRRNHPALTDYASWYRGCAGKAFDAGRKTGILLFTPLFYTVAGTEYRPLRHGFFVAGKSREEMLAYDRHLRNAFKHRL
jgi:hypothetical protein